MGWPAAPSVHENVVALGSTAAEIELTVRDQRGVGHRFRVPTGPDDPGVVVRQ